MNQQEAKKLEKHILETLTKHLKKGQRVIAGISGGPDSIFLLHFLQKADCKIVVAHINHQLRKNEANKDEKFVENLAKSLSLPYFCKKVDIKALSTAKKTGIEETGRKERYKHFNQLKKQQKADLIATAHHADDNLETIIMNFARGASLKGLSGMETLENDLFRPLREITKQEITQYLDINKIEYRIDKSNESTVYRRNAIRKNIIPELKKLNPNIAKTISKNAKILDEIDEYLIENAQKWVVTKSLTKAKKTFPAIQFRQLHPALQKQIIRLLYILHTNSTKNLENTHIEEILKIIKQKIGNKSKKFGKLTFSINKSTLKVSVAN